MQAGTLFQVAIENLAKRRACNFAETRSSLAEKLAGSDSKLGVRAGAWLPGDVNDSGLDLITALPFTGTRRRFMQSISIPP